MIEWKSADPYNPPECYVDYIVMTSSNHAWVAHLNDKNQWIVGNIYTGTANLQRVTHYAEINLPK